VACTITAHHLALTVDDWAGQSWNYCKPVAKFPDDREALRQVIREGEDDFFCERCGSLSWIRPPTVFPRIRLRTTSFYEEVYELTGPWMRSRHLHIPILLPLTAHLLESFEALEKLEGFVSGNGRAFYKKEVASTDGNDIVRLRKRKACVTGKYTLKEEEVVSFWSGKDLEWEIDYEG